ncbi:MAG: 1-acyl-sn-glycerol-3-phosphate acyltransferase [Treponemataceae bacterium]|nr:1-acyl-sn-glycerol-3-phosphate acyltransferase [Treponemataceae bacterium]
MFKSIGKFIKILHWIGRQKPLLKQVKKMEKEGRSDEVPALIQPQVNAFAKYCVEVTGSSVDVQGIENIPTDRAVIYIANHQGVMDMPLMLGYIPYPKGFIAKIETLKIPMISTWMKHMYCVFMDRKNIKKSIQAIYDGVENVKAGHSMVIFPEGTRSRGGKVKPFKAGSFKLAFNAGADIVPVSIDGTWHVFEETGDLKGAPLRLIVHPPVKTAGTNKEEQAKIIKDVQATIEASLSQLSFAEPIEKK